MALLQQSEGSHNVSDAAAGRVLRASVRASSPHDRLGRDCPDLSARAAVERGFLDKLPFNGGTCFRKLFIGSQGRLSTDFDFTALQEHDPEVMIIEMMEAFDETFHGITFALDDYAYYDTQDGLSQGANPTYRHEWNQSWGSEIRLEISRREAPTLETQILLHDTRMALLRSRFSRVIDDPKLSEPAPVCGGSLA